MINTQYGSLNSTVTIGKDNGSISDVKVCVTNNTEVLPMTSTNIDRFEHSTSEAAQTYSPEMLVKGSDSIYATASTTSKATTAYQRRLIPKFLAAKMAGIRTYSDGSPIINSAYEYSAYRKAQNTISGDHAKLAYDKEYCYSQTGYDYGNLDPKGSCCTFAFATALSIKYNTKITPDKIKTVAGKGYVDNNTNTDIWTTNDEKYHAYKIVESSGDETLDGIDAQLQLGNPVLIHTKGKNSKNEDSEHWATVIGKENGEYIIIDPWDGTERSLDDMEIYRNSGSVWNYTILTDEY